MVCVHQAWPVHWLCTHLGLLRMWGLVDRKRKRTAQIYSLNRARLGVVREFWAGLK